MFELDLMRHGATELSHTLRGSTDDALTAAGWAQMQSAFDQAKMNRQWDVIFSSPLQRCKQFAESAAQHLDLPLHMIPQLQEMHFGDWEGVSTQYIYEHEPELLEKFWTQPTQFNPPNAESMQIFEQRVMHAVAQMSRFMAAENYSKALVITHGGVIKLLKCKALRQPLDDILKMTAELGQLNCFEIDSNLSIRFVDEKEHEL